VRQTQGRFAELNGSGKLNEGNKRVRSACVTKKGLTRQEIKKGLKQFETEAPRSSPSLSSRSQVNALGLSEYFAS
jgi:hypothetical protein